MPRNRSGATRGHVTSHTSLERLREPKPKPMSSARCPHFHSYPTTVRAHTQIICVTQSCRTPTQGTGSIPPQRLSVTAANRAFLVTCSALPKLPDVRPLTLF
eukprot:1380019-Amorphochlora_amoeboformis.AAC.3